MIIYKSVVFKKLDTLEQINKSTNIHLILQPTYFSPIIQYVAMAQMDGLKFEIEDNFQKQTYRNRCYIYGANGKQLLVVPLVHSKIHTRQKTKDVKIENSFLWQKLHFRSLQTAYRSSPYFEFYEDEIATIFDKKYQFLLDLNFKTFEVVNDCLQLEIPIQKTTEYQIDTDEIKDFRYLADAKTKKEYSFQKYTQVFNSKHGFISNLSILDLLFNEGTNAMQYLENHKILLF